MPEWSVEDALRLMDEHDIATAVVSVSTPGVHLDPAPRTIAVARAQAREVNEFAARLARRPSRPLRASSRRSACPTSTARSRSSPTPSTCCGASGVILLANNHGRYLGAPEDEPLFAELDRRRAVVFVHPSELPGPRVEGIPPFAADFLLDTTRAAYPAGAGAGSCADTAR